MKVKVLKKYFDKKLDAYQEKGKEFEVDEVRAKVLVEAGVAQIMEEVTRAEETPVVEEAPEEKKQRATRETTK